MLNNYSSDTLSLYVREREYYRPEWETKRDTIPSLLEKYKDRLIVYDETRHQVDLIYRITFPYDISLTPSNQHLPVHVFYTSEFSKLDHTYFRVAYPKDTPPTNTYIQEYLTQFQNISFVTPSEWSSLGMNEFCSRQTIIPHGVDTDLFYYDRSKRKQTRARYGIEPTDILLLNIGAMTKNKGILYILQALNAVVVKMGKTNVKLLLKGTGDLYDSKLFLESYFDELLTTGTIARDDLTRLLENHIIFTEATLPFEHMRRLYNAADLYFSPYMAEGFNMCCLESLACGLPVIVPKTGSTTQFIPPARDSYDGLVFHIESKVVEISQLKVNQMEGDALMKTFLEALAAVETNRDGGVTPCEKEFYKWVHREYNWNAVAKQLFSLFANSVIKKHTRV
ncbi:hypothetical protein HDU98_010954 [Podochytrium sp. JEL0797]|nr:hypothetical protein HDU98_010954 [Podochytrium sp. JEL0797]